MTLLIRHNMNWELIHHQKETQTNYDNKRKRINKLNYNYKAREKAMLKNKAPNK